MLKFRCYLLFDSLILGRGSGVHGSIKSGDLEAASKASSPGSGSYVDIPVSNVRSIIAKRLTESKQQIPHYYVTMECQMDKVNIERKTKIPYFNFR